MKSVSEGINLNAFEESQAVLMQAGDYTVTARRKCANVTVRNINGSAVNVGEFVFTAVFGNSKSPEEKFDLTGSDGKKRVLPTDICDAVERAIR